LYITATWATTSIYAFKVIEILVLSWFAAKMISVETRNVPQIDG
jgi:hypothetical protein